MGFFLKQSNIRIQVVLPSEDLEKVKKLAESQGLKKSTLIRVIVRDYLKNKCV